MNLPYSFKIARFPLTNGEYARFIAAGGYTEPRWWTTQGWARRKEQNKTEPFYWDEDKNKPDHPVECWWYEAMAYCAWLTAQGHAEGWLPGNEVIRLPTSLEWERAARHTDKRHYPWGNAQPTIEHANFGKHVGDPTAVGSYPLGAAVCGAQDMLGNVWEWTATPFGEDEARQPRVDFARGGDRVMVRGAAYDVNLEQMFCGSRYRFNANNFWNDNCGVRLLRPLAHPNNSSEF
jgi:formylglycine-generating enzyme required for sulfatase activity